MMIHPQLDQLESAGLVRLAHEQPELEYLFRHNLVQDAAYSSLLRQDRKRLHLLIGTLLEHQYPNRLTESAPVLARHFREAGDDSRALHYYRLAADHAASKYANAEAAAHFECALEIATRITVGDGVLVEIYTKYGRVLELSGRYEEALKRYEELEQLGQKMNQRPLQLASLLCRATIYSTPTAKFDAQRGEALSQQALALARELADYTAEAKVLWNLQLVYNFTSRYHEALAAAKASLAIARRHDLREQMAYTLNDMYNPLAATGQLDRACATLDEARTLWRELGNLPMLADNLNSSAERSYLSGQLDEAYTLAQEGLQVSQRIGNLWGQSYGLMILSFIYFERAWFSKSIQTIQDCVRLGEQVGFVVATISARAVLSLIYTTLGMLDEGMRTVEQALAVDTTHFPQGRQWAQAAQANLLCAQGALHEAEEVLTQAEVGHQDEYLVSPSDVFLVSLAAAEVALAKQDYQRAIESLDRFIANMRASGIHLFLADALHFKGIALLRQGQADQAREVLLEAELVAEQRGSVRVQWCILADLSVAELALGHVTEAKQTRARSLTLIQEIMAHLDQPDVQEAFRKTAYVMSVFNAEW